jgi:hypothetical protein
MTVPDGATVPLAEATMLTGWAVGDTVRTDLSCARDELSTALQLARPKTAIVNVQTVATDDETFCFSMLSLSRKWFSRQHLQRRFGGVALRFLN